MSTVDVRTITARGVSFPLETDGRRSTTATGRAVLADAARACDPQLADAIAREHDWRSAYGRHLRELTAAEIATGDPVAVARAGLASLHDRFELDDGRTRRRLRDAVATDAADAAPAPTRTVVGGSRDLPPRLAVPYRGRELAGDDLRAQLARWVDAGTVEPSFAAAIERVVDNPGWLDLSDLTIAVIGAGAEMGPTRWLCGWRADVLAVDLPHVTGRIEAWAEAGNGTVRLPMLATDGGTPAPGADLLADVPALAAWLAATDRPLTVGTYAYADGADHVRVAVAADAIGEHVCRAHDDVSLAMLATPTDVYAVPEPLVAEVREQAASRRVPLHERLARTASRGALFRPSYEQLHDAPDGRRYGLADSQVAQQGPNYALAKRLQRWRALVARADGHRASANVAPATSTRSVTKNRLLAAAYAGASRFGVEIFEPATSSALMAALLVHDLREDAASAAPDVPLAHPLELFTETAAHGGLWRAPWQPPSVLGLAAVTGLASRRP